MGFIQLSSIMVTNVMFGQLQSQSSGYGEKEISDIDLENII
jgi:hypothetical protein